MGAETKEIDGYTVDVEWLPRIDLSPAEDKPWRARGFTDAETMVRGGYYRGGKGSKTGWVPVPLRTIAQEFASCRRQAPEREPDGQLRLTRAGETFIDAKAKDAESFQRYFQEFAGHMNDPDVRQRLRDDRDAPAVLVALCEYRQLLHDETENITAGMRMRLLDQYMQCIFRCWQEQNRQAERAMSTALRLLELSNKRDEDDDGLKDLSDEELAAKEAELLGEVDG